MSNRRLAGRTKFKAPFAVQAPAIGPAELAQIQFAMSDIAPEWAIELHGFCSDEAALVMIPESGDDLMGPSFMISRDIYGFRVDQIHWDRVTEVGSFSSLDDVLFTLRLCLAFCAGGAMPTSMTMH